MLSGDVFTPPLGPSDPRRPGEQLLSTRHIRGGVNTSLLNMTRKTHQRKGCILSLLDSRLHLERTASKMHKEQANWPKSARRSADVIQLYWPVPGCVRVVLESEWFVGIIKWPGKQVLSTHRPGKQTPPLGPSDPRRPEEQLLSTCHVSSEALVCRHR